MTAAERDAKLTRVDQESIALEQQRRAVQATKAGRRQRRTRAEEGGASGQEVAPRRINQASDVFDDEDGDVVLAVTGVHERGAQVSELMGRDMVESAARTPASWATPTSKGRSRRSTSPSVNITSWEPTERP